MPDDPEADNYAVEVRMVALELAVNFVNGDKSAEVLTTADLITIAKDLEAYLTGTPKVEVA